MKAPQKSLTSIGVKNLMSHVKLVSWCKLKLWYLNSCHKKGKKKVTCEIHVMMQVKTLTFKVSSQWKPPKTFVISMGAKCLVLGTNATCYVWMDTHT
jgi:hypothetical protein